MPQALSEPIVILGAGVAGLITAHILLQDGFTNVTLISRDKTVGGVWARERIYPGLLINNIHGEYRFSSLDMPAPEDSETTGGRLTGTVLCQYLESFACKFLEGRAKFRLRTEVQDVKRVDSRALSAPWHITVRNLDSQVIETLTFARLVLATGGCSNSNIPTELSMEAAAHAQFKGLVFHSSEIASQSKKVGAVLGAEDAVVVVGGGKSAQDACAKLALEGRNVIQVYETPDTFLASTTPLPAAIRKSRFLSILMAHSSLKTRLERFLHQTWLGSRIAHFIVNSIHSASYQAYTVPADSPRRRASPLFWSIRTNDENGYRADNYHALVNAKKITVIAPARVAGFSNDGKGVTLRDGSSLRTKVVILATGYKSSWSSIFTKEVAEKIGIARHAPISKLEDVWNYESLKNGPMRHPDNDKWVTTIYRGIVPAKSIARRDFAIAGASFTANPGYTNEVAAHWTSAYFRGDKLRLPSTPGEATEVAERQSAWMKIRFPSMLTWVNESYSATLDFWTWPQAVDEMLEDMYLPSQRSGGNWLTWPFKTINVKEIEDLTQERRAIREASG